MKISVYRKGHFNAAHRLHNPKWSDEKNREFYGKCNNPNYHGHNYDVILKVNGEVDEKSGYLIDMKVLSDLLKNEVEDAFDHKNLNLDVEDFKHKIPSAENIAYVIWHRIRKNLPKTLTLTVFLYETERNYVEYSGE